jgi:ABC-2 type transport system ATP-binding protein
MPDPAPIRIEGLTKVYRHRLARRTVRALDAVSLEIRPGEIFGLLGPNGAGKTTLLKVLLGVVRPTTGRALLFDLPVHQPRARIPIGFLPENHRFPEVFTAEGLLFAYGRLSGVPPAQLREAIPRLLALTGIGDWRKARIRTFSKGMMQRLGLAQALLNDPNIVFLDEPTDGVDPIGRREIRDVLAGLKKEGKTIFLNSHLLSEVERICDRIAILNKGALVYEGDLAGIGKTAPAVELTVSEVPAPLLASLQASFIFHPLGPDAAGHPRFRVDEATPVRLDAVVDALRAGGVSIHAILPLRRSLEEAFIQLLTDDGTGGGLTA